jgi:hypothetical protein
VKAQNETEALEGLRRDRGEKDDLVFRQIEERQKLQQDIKTQREAAQAELLQLRADVAEYMTLDNQGQDHDHDHSRKPNHDPDGDDDEPRPRPPRSRRRRGFEP